MLKAGECSQYAGRGLGSKLATVGLGGPRAGPIALRKGVASRWPSDAWASGTGLSGLNSGGERRGYHSARPAQL